MLPDGIFPATGFSLLDGGNSSLVEGAEGCSYFLHLLAVDLAESLEIRLDLLGYDACSVGDELCLLDIDFAQNQLLDLFKLVPDLVRDDRDDELEQRLADLDGNFATESKHHGSGLLGKFHTFLEILVDDGRVGLRHIHIMD